MRKFYHEVDKRSRSEMSSYLKNHFRYSTMNSLNRSTSYACNLKIHSLGFGSEITLKLYDLMQADDFYDPINDLMSDFNETHNHLWQAAMNGRSGGYLVLYQGELKASGYKSYCPICGQQNFKSIAENSNICGRCLAPSRRDYSKTHTRVITYPGRGTDESDDFEDWDIGALRERVSLIQEFDQLADAIAIEALYLAKNYVINEKMVFIPKTKLTLMQSAI